MRSVSTSLIWRGVLAVILGAVSIIWPTLTVGGFVVLFAVYAFVVAITELMHAFAGDRVSPVLGHLLLAVLSVGGGIAALVWPDLTALTLTVWIAAWALVIGVIEIAMAFRRGETAGERAMWALTGLLSVALGMVLFLRPGLGALSLATVFGFFSLAHGTAAVVLGIQARRAKTA